MVTQILIRKVLPFEVKEVAPRVLEFVGSTEDKDRMGDIIIASGWQLKNYKKNPVFLWAHQYDMPPVGKAVKVWTEEDRLKFHVQFPTREEYEFADTIYKLYKGGYLRASSVGFMPLESEPIEQKDDDETIFFHPPTRYLKQDLLELSGCPVPANPNALAEAKTKGIISEQEWQIIEKPYPNEHACRLRDPDDFKADSFRRTKRQHEGKEYSVIMGRLKGEDTMTEQAYRYDKDIWTAKAANTHCKDHDGAFEPATNEGEETIEVRSAISYQTAHPNGTPKASEDEEWEAGKEVAAAEVEDLKVMCTIVQGDADLKTSYKLPHHKAAGSHILVWRGVSAAGAVLMGARGGIDATEAEKIGAKAHLAKHYEEFDREPPWEAERGISQEQIADEIDYLLTATSQTGLNEMNTKSAWLLLNEIMRLSGDDIPVDIQGKIGAVLNKANRERLEKIKTFAQEVIDSAKHEEEPEPEKGLTADEITEIVQTSISLIIREAQGKINKR